MALTRAIKATLFTALAAWAAVPVAAAEEGTRLMLEWGVGGVPADGRSESFTDGSGADAVSTRDAMSLGVGVQHPAAGFQWEGILEYRFFGLDGIWPKWQKLTGTADPRLSEFSAWALRGGANYRVTPRTSVGVGVLALAGAQARFERPESATVVGFDDAFGATARLEFHHDEQNSFGFRHEEIHLKAHGRVFVNGAETGEVDGSTYWLFVRHVF